MDVYAIVTEKIISLLEQGVVPCRRPWTGSAQTRHSGCSPGTARSRLYPLPTSPSRVRGAPPALRAGAVVKFISESK
jgi:hypothetical protein